MAQSVTGAVKACEAGDVERGAGGGGASASARGGQGGPCSHRLGLREQRFSPSRYRFVSPFHCLRFRFHPVVSGASCTPPPPASPPPSCCCCCKYCCCKCCCCCFPGGGWQPHRQLLMEQQQWTGAARRRHLGQEVGGPGPRTAGLACLPGTWKGRPPCAPAALVRALPLRDLQAPRNPAAPGLQSC